MHRSFPPGSIDLLRWTDLDIICLDLHFPRRLRHEYIWDDMSDDITYISVCCLVPYFLISEDDCACLRSVGGL